MQDGRLPVQRDPDAALRLGVDLGASPLRTLTTSFISRLAASGWAKIACSTLR